MTLKLFFGLAIASALFAQVSYEDAYALYKEGKFKSSLRMFEELVKEQNDSDAAYILGYMYEHGEGCEIDLKKANEYYKTSSHGYYWETKLNPNRESSKEYKKVFSILDKPEDDQTQKTIKKHVEALYNIKAYKPTYFLPLSSRLDSGEYAQTGTGATAHTPLKNETEFQVSLKYDMFTNLLGLNEIYTIAYTQRSFWQLYVDSAYFRETNYNPEMFVTFPIKQEWGPHSLKAAKIGFAHQSNGRGGIEERSWNYFYGVLFFQYKNLFSELKLWSSWDEALTYNPDLMEYLGHGHIRFSLPYKKHLTRLKFRSAFNGNYALEADYSYPLLKREDLFFYIKGFSGYGESLIDYNRRVDKIGFGFSISR